MNMTEMTKAMKASISEVLEQMFFLPIDMVEASEENMPICLNDNKFITAGVGFEGALSGTFVLNVPAGLAASITADFLGVLQEELSAEQIGGTIKEMLNMLAGNSLSGYNSDTPFELKIPELMAETKEIKGSIDVGIETPDSRMSLHMTVEQL